MNGKKRLFLHLYLRYTMREGIKKKRIPSD